MARFSTHRFAARVSSMSRRFRMSRTERYAVFREMAKGELRHGEISSRRQENLLDYAGRLGIRSADAVELVNEARRTLGLSVESLPSEQPWYRRVGSARAVPLWLAISIVSMVVAILTLLLRGW